MPLFDEDDRVIICKGIYYPVGDSDERPVPANRVLDETSEQPLRDDDPVYGEDGWGSYDR